MSKFNIVSGKKYRILTDVVNKVWDTISFWTKASDVEFDDGTTAQAKLGSITGVTDSLDSTSTTLMATANAAKTLNDKITSLSNRITTVSNEKSQIYNAFVNVGVRPTSTDTSALVTAVNTLSKVFHINGMTTIPTSGYTCSYNGCVHLHGYYLVTNHDNSGEMDASMHFYKNGTIIYTTSCHVGSFGGGTLNMYWTFGVSAGDYIYVQVNTSNDKSINWSGTAEGVYIW